MPNNTWKPSANIAALKQRAEVLAQIRQFFKDRNVFEVETPLLCHATVTDPYIQSMQIQQGFLPAVPAGFLQTSPEYAMKRLLAAGSGSIFQLCKAFRHDEVGWQHNPEFTLLEWYRVGFDHHALMQEIDALLQYILKTKPAEKLSYQQVFLHYLNIDPLDCELDDLIQLAKRQSIDISGEFDRDDWLNLLFTHCIEHQLGHEAPLFMYDYPASQAALAKINPNDNRVAERFEVYINGIELANGFHELCDAKEQRARFERDLTMRQEHHITEVPIDENFLQALAHGLPDCAGVALGVDRLLMLALQKSSINEVISFTFDRA